MTDIDSRRLMKRLGFVKLERIKDPRSGTVQDVISGPLQDGGEGKIKIAPADQTKAGLRRQLMNRAFLLPEREDDRNDLYHAIAESEARRIVQYAERNGWSEDGSYFILQDQVLGRVPKGQRGLLFDLTAHSHRLGVAGTLEAWKTQVAAQAIHSSAMLTGLAAAFAAPLLTFSGGMSSWGLCFSGSSRSGKTIATFAAASVMGWPGKQPLRTWDMTEAAMDDLLSAANDLLTPIDDLMSLKGGGATRIRQLDELSYKLTSGRGRARHQVYEREHGTAGTWQTIVLTSNEQPLAELSRSYQRPQGATIRMVDVPVAMGGSDLFDRFEDIDPSRRDALKGGIVAACQCQYGTPIIAFVEHLLTNPDAAKATVVRHISFFTAKVSHFSDTDLTRDLARKFGLLFAAARLASSSGIVDWSEERIQEALTRTYQAAREQLADDGKLLRDGCASLLREMRRLPRKAHVAHGGGADDLLGFRYQTASHHHCWLRNMAFDRLFTRPQRDLVERWLVQQGRIELTPARKGRLGGQEIKRQHHWIDDRATRVRALHIIWPRQRSQAKH